MKTIRKTAISLSIVGINLNRNHVLLSPSLTELTERTILVGVHILANIMYNDCHHKQASNIVGRHHNGCNRSGKLQIDLMFYILHQHLECK
ncbi:hypothetical protein DERP_001333 [Dermatophagoides pteronyssinus]|uniref:Uncharacterized protein n=1 Tax=Dermatophagoides pteronyssinus TaxID=6956 RepID=A0ABQ8JE67_DERPT|nr:hypothetical protein DERP_001333 [Dermatophagoides pteronyssinus]